MDGNSNPAADPSNSSANGHGIQGKHPVTGSLVLAATGVVYGDIGTSPIYAFREALRAASGAAAPNEMQVLGVLSIILWSLILIVSIKYALIVLKADNRGEGGTLSLMALAMRPAVRHAPLLLGLGIVGAALFFGDAIITPAISVLSAVEGLEVVTPALTPYVLPITLAIVAALFLVQSRGTASVARVFGPVTAFWFLVIGLTGLYHILLAPQILWAVNPLIAVQFLHEHSTVALIVIGAAFLAITGAEAIYADLGHFGRRPVVMAWFLLVFPCLLLNYFGQGAYVLSHGGPVGQPLFEMVPAWATLPFVVLAMIATVIACQAVISGAFSLTSQAIQLGLLPRMTIRHTSDSQSGQIYMPQINFLLLVGVTILVLEFGSSAALASAYGIAVTGEMIVTALLLLSVFTGVWRKPLWLAIAVVAPFLLIDIAFLWANVQKFADGGWVSIAIAAALTVVMMTWRRGNRVLFHRTRKSEVQLDALVGKLRQRPPVIVPGNAVFLTSDADSAPTALLHSLKHYRVLHERNAIVTIVTEDRPRLAACERASWEKLDERFVRITLHFGYAERPNVPKALSKLAVSGWSFDPAETSFFLSRRSLRKASHSGMPKWQELLYILLARNGTDATAYFQIPTGRVVEIGTQVAI